MNLQKPIANNKPKLFDYFRSSCAYRVRIALNLKGIEYEHQNIDLRLDDHHAQEYRHINPQGLVPALEINGHVLSQSLAIIDYLEHLYPEPALLPLDPLKRAEVLELSYIVACDIHPLNNLRALNYLTNHMGIIDDGKLQWYHHWIREGFVAYEARLALHQRRDTVSYGDEITLADICLIPQVYNALRFDCDMSEFKRIMRVYESCMKLSAFEKASPDSHPDAS